jgi:hypothetical protein
VRAIRRRERGEVAMREMCWHCYVYCGGVGWGDERRSILCLGRWMMMPSSVLVGLVFVQLVD